MSTLDITVAINHHTRVNSFLQQDPFNIKLNAELSLFFGNLYTWTTAYTPTSYKLNSIVYLVGFKMGNEFNLIILSLLYIGHYVYYIVMSRIFNIFISSLYSLLLLFRSKRFNTLKNRSENAHFELDQLVLGTILFIPIVLAFPTVLVFYCHSVFMFMEIASCHFIMAYIHSINTTEFDYHIDYYDCTLFYPSMNASLILNHLKRSLLNTNFILVNFSLYQQNTQHSIKSIAKGIPLYFKRGFS